MIDVSVKLNKLSIRKCGHLKNQNHKSVPNNHILGAHNLQVLFLKKL
jgi:hypothetical protein